MTIDTDRPKEVRYWDGNTYHPYVAVGLLRSTEPFDFGTFSCEMKLPKGHNLSASFWLSGDNTWPPEIDVEECWDRNGKVFDWFTSEFPWFNPSWRTTNNVHYNDCKGDPNTKTSIKSKNIPWCKQKLDPAENFIEYSCLWKPDTIEFYANGKLTRKVTGSVPVKLVEYNTKPEHVMDAILNVVTDADPAKVRTDIQQDLLIRNFKYTPL
jgi:beta-glucanase (GH16 family)